jgi:hypothetical protein
MHITMAGGLKIDEDQGSHYGKVRAQLIEGKWNLSGAIPHRQILDWNVANGNWEADA